GVEGRLTDPCRSVPERCDAGCVAPALPPPRPSPAGGGGGKTTYRFESSACGEGQDDVSLRVLPPAGGSKATHRFESPPAGESKASNRFEPSPACGGGLGGGRRCGGSSRPLRPANARSRPRCAAARPGA